MNTHNDLLIYTVILYSLTFVSLLQDPPPPTFQSAFPALTDTYPSGAGYPSSCSSTLL